MATLEKIRSKSVLLLVIIGVALLAFVIGDFFTSGRTFFGSGTTVAKVGGHKIDVQDFQRRMEQANQQAQQSGQKIDQAALQQQVLNSMIAETLYQTELDELGLTVTDAELTEAMLGRGSGYVDMMVRQSLGIDNAATLHDMAFNPVKYGMDENQAAQLKNYWIQLEKQMEQTLLQQKFNALFMGTLVANELDAKAMYDENASTSHIAYAKKDFTTVPDDQYPVSDSEIEQEWAKDKELYKLPEEVRTVNYIAVEIAPSADDRLNAEKKIEDAIAALRNQPETEGLSSMTEFVVDRRKTATGNIRDTRLKSFVDSASVGQVGVVSHIGNDYTIAKLLGRSSEVDSVNVDYVMMSGNRAEIDSVVRALNAGSKFADLANNPAVQASQDSLWVSMVDPQMNALREEFLSANTGVFFTPDTLDNIQGARIFRINRRKAPVAVCDVAVVSFTTEPSRATVNKLESDLMAFIKANNTSALFAEKAGEAGYTAIPAQVSASTPQLDRMSDSRSAVNWAMNAKKGTVSQIFGDEQTGRFIVVALNDIYDDYIPARDPQLKATLTARVRNDKKAAALIDQYNGKANDVAAYANLMDTKVDSTTVSFGRPSIARIGFNESNINAAVAAAKPNTLVGPVKSNTGVVVFEVTEVDSTGRPFNFDESSAQYNRTRGAAALGNVLPLILQGNQEVTNNLLKFFRD